MDIKKIKASITRKEIKALIDILENNKFPMVRRELRLHMADKLGKSIDFRRLSLVKEIGNKVVKDKLLGSNTDGWYIVKDKAEFLDAYKTYRSRRKGNDNAMRLLEKKYYEIFGGQLELDLEEEDETEIYSEQLKYKEL